MKRVKKLLKKLPWYAKEYAQEKFYWHKIFSLRISKIFAVILLFLIISPVAIFFYYRPKIQHNINYGVTFSNKYAEWMGLDWQETYLAILDDLKVKNLRLVMYWDETEPVNGEFDYSKIKWQLDHAESRNLSVILALGRKVPRYPECFEPTWWEAIPGGGEQDQKLFEYIERSINELKPYYSIKIWQVENEPFWDFGDCLGTFNYDTVAKEVQIVRNLDTRPILTQDSGEGGLWRKAYSLGDYLGISMYRKIWYDFWGVFFRKFVYFQYPLAHWTYAVKAGLVGVPHQNIIVTELQGEPWGPGLNSELSQEEKDKTMSRNDFYATLDYAQKAGFKDLYLWGVEWWYFEKEVNNNAFFWNTAKALFEHPEVMGIESLRNVVEN